MAARDGMCIDMLRTVVALACLVGACACGDTMNSRDAIERREAEHGTSRSAGAGRTSVRVSGEPVAVWGGDSSPALSGPVLTSVVAARLLESGDIAVADGAMKVVELFDASGTHRRTLGGEGRGPGEFSNIFGMWAIPGDSLLVHDMLNARSSVVDVGTTAVRSVHLQSPRDQPYVLPVGRFADGRILSSTPGQFGRTEEAVYRDTLLYFLHQPDGTLVDTIMTVLGDEYMVLIERGAGEIARLRVPVPFGMRSFVRVADASIVVYDGGRSISVLSEHGDSLGAIEVAATPAVLQADEIERYRRERLTRAESQRIRAALERRLARMRFPSRKALVQNVLVDAASNVWVRTATAETEHASAARWLVYAFDGTIRGQVDLPRDLSVLDIGDDRLIGMVEDSLGAVHGYLYPIVRTN